MNPCPYCGNITDGFIIKGFVAGSCDRYFGSDGNYTELDTDKMYWKSTKETVRCGRCFKIRRDVYFDGEKILCK